MKFLSEKKNKISEYENNLIIENFHNFCKVDENRIFKFTSGNLGAVSSNSEKNKYKLILVILIGILIPYKNILVASRTFLRRKKEKNEDFKIITLSNKKQIKDSYYGELLDKLEKPNNVVHIIGGLSVLNKKYNYIEGYLDILSKIKILVISLTFDIYSIFYLYKTAKKLTANKEEYVYFGLVDIKNNACLNAFILNKSIECMIEKHETRKILYPMEGRSWEKRIASISKNNKIRTIGYIHCIITPRHQSLLSTKYYKDQELPTVIVTPGKIINNIITKNFKECEVIEGFFLRGDVHKQNYISNNERVILFLLISDIYEGIYILNQISSLPLELKNKCRVKINNNVKSAITLKKMCKKYGVLELNEIKDNPVICLFRSSSSSIDYLKKGIDIKYLKINEFCSNNTFRLSKRDFIDEFEFGINSDKVLMELLEEDRKIHNGKLIANYYLNQNFNGQELKELANKI